jgi:hypothetical protein
MMNIDYSTLPQGDVRLRPDVAITVDRFGPPPDIVLVRGRAVLDEVDGAPDEYEQLQIRDHGQERGAAMIAGIPGSGGRMVRIVVRPTWVSTLDFQTRFPAALVAAGLAPGEQT